MSFLEVRDLRLVIDGYDGEAHVLNGIDLSVERGQIWGIVGETGCGKSLTGLSISRLVPTPPGRYVGGSIRLSGKELLTASPQEMSALRGRHIGMIFQDPTTNLNPTFRIGSQMIDVALHAAKFTPDLLGLPSFAGHWRKRRAARELAIEMLRKVGVNDPASRVDDFPYQFSGGMRQRVLIAMALIGQPELLIADEPTTALDVSVQAQILRLIHSLVKERQLAALFITHNLGVVAQIASHVAVMYAGSIIESGTVHDIFKRPAHPYTHGLLASVPSAAAPPGELRGIAGVVPDPLHLPPGCRFAPRCSFAMPKCMAAFPATLPAGEGHSVACVLAEQRAGVAA